MLRNRSRAVTKQALMADHSSQQSPSQPRRNPFSSFSLTSPKFMKSQSVTIPDNELPLLSQNPILLSPVTKPFSRNLNSPRKTFSEAKQKQSRGKGKPDSEANIGLKLIGTLMSSTHSEKTILFAVQNPPFWSKKIQNLQEWRSGSEIKTEGEEFSQSVPKKLTSEMKLSEEYTGMTVHGPNPRTTHIFNDRIVESSSSLPEVESNAKPETERYRLGLCCTCKKSLQHNKDIYMYRGEKAFCSSECRLQGMMVDNS